MAKYLITGVAGFIGSALALRLIEDGHSVRGVDNLITGKKENISGVKGLDFREVDILDVSAMAEACRDIDFILHEAALGSVPRSVADPATTNSNNVEGTLNVLMAARAEADRSKKKLRVVFAASSSAYGDTPTLPKREDMFPNPMSPYAVTKLAGEFYMQAFWRVYGLETVSLRYFNIFGPRQDADSQYSAVMAKFITAMLRGDRLTVFGDGTQSRDFTYIDNAVSANLLACETPADKVCGKTFNIACGGQVTLIQMVESLNRLMGTKIEPIFASERAGDIKHSFADISLAQKSFGYKPLVGFEDGLKKTIAWYEKQSAVSSR
jgi:UDP-N-acetylglucosamine/UDP-N-acetyl-alpha-D-glucosaminouronate 4-epimerase